MDSWQGGFLVAIAIMFHACLTQSSGGYHVDTSGIADVARAIRHHAAMASINGGCK